VQRRFANHVHAGAGDARLDVTLLYLTDNLPDPGFSSTIGTPQYIRAYHEVSLMERTDQFRDELGYRTRFMVIGGEPASVLLEVAEGYTE
jgi:hypothetical protein